MTRVEKCWPPVGPVVVSGPPEGSRGGHRLSSCNEVELPVPARREKARPPLLTVDIALPDVEELHKLVDDGQEKGFLTYDEIVSALEEVELSKEQIEDFYTYLIDHSIELHEGEQHKHPPHEQPSLAVEDDS